MSYETERLKAESKRASLALKHIAEWIDQAKLGQRRVIARDPLCPVSRIVVNKCRPMGIIDHNHGRWVLEKL